MMLFRKSKVLKILKEYQRVYQSEIPENALAREELLALKDITLEELAIAYDALEGYKYYENLSGDVGQKEPNVRFHMPDRSRFKPSCKLATHYSPALLRDKVRYLKNSRFLERNDFISDVERTHEVTFIEGGSRCWKRDWCT